MRARHWLFGVTLAALATIAHAEDEHVFALEALLRSAD